MKVTASWQRQLAGAVGLALASGAFTVPVQAVTGLGIKVAWTAGEPDRAQAASRRPPAWFTSREEAAARYLRISGLAGGYGRWVIDLERGWPTERLDLEPLAVAHAAELAPLLDDAALHEFTGAAPLSAAALAARYARLAARRSPGGDQLWGNWVIRVRATGAAAGTVQATLPAAGPAAGPAEVAWVVARAAQGRGYASEAARSLVTVLRQAGWTVIAHIHPRHYASQRVARAARLVPTTGSHDGEIRWVSPPPAAP